MRNSPFLKLDRDFKVVEKFLLPRHFIGKYKIVHGKAPLPELTNLVKKKILLNGHASELTLGNWNLQVVLDPSNEYYHIELVPDKSKPLSQEQDKYKLLVESANDIICETNVSGKFIYVNPKSVELTGYSKEELIGKTYFSLVREDWQPRVKEFYANQFRESLKSTYLEFPLIKKSGQEIWVGLNVQLLEDSRGINGLMAIGRNITTRYEAQTALKISEEKYRSIIQNLQFGLMEVDLDGYVIFANEAMYDITGYSKDELVGQNAERLLLSTDASSTINGEHVKRESGIASAYELPLNAKGGDIKWALISGAPKFDLDGNISGTIGIHVDITERKKNENELEATKAKLNRYKLGTESINEISSNTQLSFEDQLREGLKIASQYLDLPTGVLSRVRNNKYRILDFYTEGESTTLKKGLEFDLSETYCDLTLQHDNHLAISNFGDSEFSDHPCYQQFGLESYISSAYYVQGELRGTVNFSSIHKRAEPFDLYDLEFIELLSKWVGFILTQKETLTALNAERIKLKSQNMELQFKEAYLTAINEFVTKLLDNESFEDMAWEIAENVIDSFGYEDCVIYVINRDKNCLEQVAAYGPKKAKNRKIVDPIFIELGKGIVGSVALSGKAEIVGDTSKDSRYIQDDEIRFSEISVPIIADGEVIGVIDSEHPRKYFFTESHLTTLTTIANLAANRMKHAIAKKQQLKAEKELKDSELKLRNILHSAIDGVISINDQGIITEWNKQAEVIFGYEAKEIIGRTLQETIIPHNFREQHMKGMSHYMKTGEGPVLNQKIEILALRKNGEKFPIELAIIPVVMGGEHSFTAFVSDITVQKRVQEEMEKALQKEKELNELKSRFVAMTSHEFRTPLTTIKQNIDLISFRLENKLPDYANTFKKYIQRVESEIKRVTDLMNDILMLGRLDAGKVTMKLESLDFVSYASKLIEKMTENRADGRQVHLEIEGVPRKIDIDPSLFDHILNNLISNALKYSEGKPNPHISLRFNELETMQIRVKDYGIGIPQKDHKSLFQSFYRATNVKNIQGSGLGLSIVREFTLMHGGDIHFNSIEEQGTEFILDIPYNSQV
jgi:PAS domain S-box-containing protein